MVTPVSSEKLSMSAHNKALKTTEETALQILLLCQIGIGTVANILLFIHNFSPIFDGIQLKPTQVILSHVAVANALILLITGFPNNMTVFAPRNPLTDLKCKLQYFIRLVARSINLCSTCVLSTHQFVTLVPGTWGRVMLRGKAPNLVSYSCNSCWLLGVLNNIYIPMKVTGPQKTGNDTDSKSKMVCSTSGFSVGIVFLRFAHDATFISIMTWTSVSMVLFLYRHHQRTQCMSVYPNQNHRGHAETRAAHTILLLVVTFVSFYLLNFICIIFQTVLMGSHFWLRHVGEVLAVSFPTVSPLLLLSRDPKDPCSLLFKH
ncbi:Vomeronasal type-1 receptor 1 [Microtus ochrogaster]|uniref:Vomeronasal type-1 receptor n=1 Tax=Microtus ochrogaster TaxID=79684 RepID=A0A8J6G9K0_MICOH|nr:Vomeronasal type-1 receptor 1 [Microtus ochrogaster]